jgi:tetratricopeptide (TPR) repeat protein
VDAWLRYWLGVSLHQSDQPVQALRAYQQARSAIAAGAVRDPELKMLICQGLGQIYRLLGSTARAITFLTLALDAGLDACAPQSQGVIAFELGLAYHEQGDLPRAKGLLAQALQQVEQLNQLPLTAQVRSYLGLVLLHLQQDKEAERQLRQGLGMALRSGDPSAQGITLGNLAAWQLAHGQPEQAIRSVQGGLAMFQQKEEPRLVGHLSLLLAQAYEAEHQLAAAERELLSAISLLAPTRHAGLLDRAHERYGQFLAAQGRFQEAYQQLQLAWRLLKIGKRRFR